MKLMIASDIHGSAFFCESLLEAFDREGARRLILLGDLLYHGPRNPLPTGYDPARVAALLNARKDRIFCVRGNCDSEVDQIMLEFPILADYALMPFGEHMMFLTHGHIFSPENQPPLQPKDLLVSGHTHVPLCEKRGEIFVLNPGSVGIPKESSPHSYMILEDERFLWRDLSGKTYNTVEY